MTILFKRTSSGAVQIWRMEISEDTYRTVSGQIDGIQVVSEWRVALPKNEGKKNGTTGPAQAEAEVAARYKVKLEQGGYHSTIENIDKPKFLEPMLAHKFKPESYSTKDFASGLVYSQPKLDGVRCIVRAEGMFSRRGKPIISAPHIRAALEPLFLADPDFIFDGELYAGALADDFNTIISMAKQSKPTAEDLAKSATGLQYWIYDMPSSEETFGERTQLISRLLAECHNSLVVVPTHKAESREALDGLYGGYLESGMEGQMIRDGNSIYESGRTKSLLKRKEFQDAEYRIVHINEGQGNWAGYAKSVTFDLGDGTTFRAGIKGNQEFTKALLEDATAYAGQEATVRYQNLTPDGIPRFGVVYAFHRTDRM